MPTIEEIKQTVSRLGKQYGVEKIYLFGSYARGDNNEKSDIDFRIDSGDIKTLFQLSGFRLELEDALKIPVDIVTSDNNDTEFLNAIRNDEVKIYG